MRRLLGLVPVLLFAITGCSSSGDAAPPSTTAAVDTTTAPPPTGPLPAAADGANLAACSDGTCEVLIVPGDKIAFAGDVVGFAQLTIDNVDATGVYTRGTGPGINLTLGEQTPGTPYTMNRLVMSVIGFNPGQAVLRLTPVA